MSKAEKVKQRLLWCSLVVIVVSVALAIAFHEPVWAAVTFAAFAFAIGVQVGAETAQL